MELKLPHRWSDLSLGELQVMMTADNPLEKISICSGYSVEKLRAMPQKLIEAATAHLDNLLTQETARHEKVVEMDGKRFGFIPSWDEFTAGEWIDMENHLEDFWANAQNYRSTLSGSDLRTRREIRDKEVHHQRRRKHLRRDARRPCLGYAAFFLDFQKSTASRYAVLFAGGSGQSDPVGEKWGWYHLLYSLAGEDVLKMDAITELPVQVIFQHLSYLKDRSANDHV